MERGSDKHGPRLDEQLEKETRGIVQGGREPRAGEWKSDEPSGEDQPGGDRGPDGTPHGGVPDGMSDEHLEQRAELASFLGKEIWPAEGAQVKARLRQEQAPTRVIDRCEELPDGRVYDNVAQVWEDLTGHKEAHRF